MFIGEIRNVNDLRQGQRALPERGVVYYLRAVSSQRLEAGRVTHVVRRGDVLVAHTTTGQEVAISGEGGFVLVPKSV